MDTKDCYIAGNTNIGKKERSRRSRKGWIYFFLTIVTFVALVLSDLPRVYRLLVYLPATLSALGFLQSKFSFCVYYGLKGEYHFDNNEKRVTDNEDLSADRRASLNILIVSLSIGFAVTVLAYLIF